MQENTLFLLDAYALIYRAHFALSQNPRLTTKGMNTSAIMGFTNSLLEVITKEKPSHIGVAFDTEVPTFRHREFKEYKATRQSMPEEIRIAIPYCKKIILGFNIPILMKDGYEADDLIGTVSKQASAQGFKVFMMTPDKDYAQLVDKNISLYKPARMGNAIEVMGVKEVLEKFNICRVDQVRDVLGLKGDAVDNIPGIAGIGDKTAAKLLKEFDTVENIVKHVGQLKGALKTKIEKNGELGILSKKLATIETDSPVAFHERELRYEDPDPTVLKPIFDELEFRTISRRVFQEDNYIKGGDTGQLGFFGDSTQDSSTSGFSSIATLSHTYHLVEDSGEICALAEKLADQSSFCFDTETTSLETREAELVGIAFAIEKGQAWYVPCHRQGERIQYFKEVLENPTIQKIGQNLKYDIQVLRNYGIRVAGTLFDTMLAHFLIDPESANNMDLLAKKYLTYKTISYESLVGPKGRNQKTIDQIDKKKVSDYACEDADITLQLKEIFEKEIQKCNLDELLHEVEEPLSFVLADMEYEGVKVDTTVLGVMSKELDEESVRVKGEVFKLAGVEFNIGSPKQLGEVLFERLKLAENPKKTKTGQYATGESVLSKLAKDHDIAAKILEFREYQKLKSTYVDALPKLISFTDGRIHTDYRQTVATTGRLSSNNPNLQNIPIRTLKGREIRKAFVPRDEDYLIMSADYSQIELRIMADFSRDEHMMRAFEEGRDIHASTASKVFGVDPNEVESSMRRRAKEINFGIIYGISAYGLSQNLNISRSEAQAIIDSYFKEFPDVKNYMDKTIERARKNEYVETILGRRRYLRNIHSKNFTMRGFDERNAINAPIQGSAADIIKIAMIHIHQWMTKEKVQSKMLMQVHDELVFDVHKSEAPLMKEKVEYFMKKASPLEVVMEISVNMGENWLEAH